MKTAFLVAASTAILLGGVTPADAQHYHTHRYGYRAYQPLQPQHYHDAAGHMVDSYGHHVDTYGHHTGGVGLYDGNVPGNYLPYANNGYAAGGYTTGNYGGQAPLPPGFGLPIKISNPTGAPSALRYTLNGFLYVIQPGEVQTLTNDRTWVMQFDRGGEFGTARYTLTPGSYEFTLALNGWEIYQETAPSTAAIAAPSGAVLLNPLPPTANLAPPPMPKVPAK